LGKSFFPGGFYGRTNRTFWPDRDFNRRDHHDPEWHSGFSGDDTLILWLQSLTNPHLAFPVLEPRIYKNDYVVRLSASELRELRLDSIKEASVFTILTIPGNLTEMTANLKAPVVINTRSRIAKQVVLQENDQPIKHPMFQELRTHLMGMSRTPSTPADQEKSVLPVNTLPISTRVELI
jgi:flagellar assembly factor FliW